MSNLKHQLTASSSAPIATKLLMANVTKRKHENLTQISTVQIILSQHIVYQLILQGPASHMYRGTLLRWTPLGK